MLKTSLLLCSLSILLPGCLLVHPTGDDQAQPTSPSAAVVVVSPPGIGTSCPSTVAETCGASGCPSWPSTRGAWCTAGDHPAGAQAGLGLCDGFGVVESVSGDQATDFLYSNDDGSLIAVVAWSSSGACAGACTASCLAGPSTLDLDAVRACVDELRWGATCE